jgi:hypothetical protein
MARSLKEHERRLALHPQHLGRIPANLRERIYLEGGFGTASVPPAPPLRPPPRWPPLAAPAGSVAVPVSSREAAVSLARQVDAFVCLATPPLLLALDEWYEDFAEVSDEDVIALLAHASHR